MGLNTEQWLMVNDHTCSSVFGQCFCYGRLNCGPLPERAAATYLPGNLRTVMRCHCFKVANSKKEIAYYNKVTVGMSGDWDRDMYTSQVAGEYWWDLRKRASSSAKEAGNT